MLNGLKRTMEQKRKIADSKLKKQNKFQVSEVEKKEQKNGNGMSF